MSRTLLIFFLLLYCVSKVSSKSNDTIETTFNGLAEDFNFGHLGYVYMDSDETLPELKLSNCPNYDVNRSICGFPRDSPKSDGNIMVLRAWTAVTLRDNILVILGYLMHQSMNDLIKQEIRSSLRLLHEDVRSHGVHTMELVPKLKTLTKWNRPQQLIALLKSLLNVVTHHTRSVVDEIGKYFSKRRELLRNILNEQKGLDLFSDIGMQMIPMLRMKVSRRGYEHEVQKMLGKEFAIFFNSIKESKVILTQPVLAAFILNMKFPDLSAAEMEKLRFICDALRLNKVPNWAPGFSNTCCSNFHDPYELLQAMMNSIIKHPGIDGSLKNAIIEVLPKLIYVSKPDYSTRRADRFFSKPAFNVTMFMELLADEVNVPEVNILADMINSGSVNLTFALKGFVRFAYDTPRTFAQAFLERVKYRVPMSTEASGAIDIILSALEVKPEKKREKVVTEIMEATTEPVDEVETTE